MNIVLTMKVMMKVILVIEMINIMKIKLMIVIIKVKTKKIEKMIRLKIPGKLAKKLIILNKIKKILKRKNSKKNKKMYNFF